MKKKPTILVVGKEDPALHDLREKYDLIFQETDYSTSPFAQAKKSRRGNEIVLTEVINCGEKEWRKREQEGKDK